MTDLTPKKRAELRRRIQFRRNLEYEQVSLLLDEVAALLDSTDELDRLRVTVQRVRQACHEPVYPDGFGQRDLDFANGYDFAMAAILAILEES